MLRTLQSWLARRIPAKSLGQRGEDFAARYLKKRGYHIIARHVDSRLGELDIVAVDGRTIVFVEVKTRSSDDAGTPEEAIDNRKRQRMTQAALGYLKTHGLLNHAARFDVVAVTWPADARRPNRVDHLRNAFDATGIGQMYS